MSRVKGGIKQIKKRKKVMKLARGFRGMRGSSYKIAKQSVMKALMHAYIDRRRRKRDFRRLWTIRIGAASRSFGLPYSKFIHGLIEANVKLNRKMLADIAVYDPEGFEALVKIAQQTK
jgi:large subunit ribosomal protein L20